MRCFGSMWYNQALGASPIRCRTAPRIKKSTGNDGRRAAQPAGQEQQRRMDLEWDDSNGYSGAPGTAA